MKSLCLIVDIRLLLLLLKEEEVKDGNTLVTICVWIPIKKIVFGSSGTLILWAQAYKV